MDSARKIIYRSLILEGLLMIRNHLPGPLSTVRTQVYRDIADALHNIVEASITDFQDFNEADEKWALERVYDLMHRYSSLNVGRFPEYLRMLSDPASN